MKRGSIVFADMTWFVIFTILVLFMYFVLFRELEGKMDNKINPSSLETDADFIATTLPRLIVHTPDKTNDRIHYDGENFGTLLSFLVAAYTEDENTYSNRLVHEDYTEFLEQVLTDNTMQRTIPNGHKAAIGYAAFLIKDGKFMEDSCVGEKEDEPWCPTIFYKFDPATGILQPDIVAYADSSRVLRDGKGIYYDYGVAHVPTEHGTVTIAVLIVYEVRR